MNKDMICDSKYVKRLSDGRNPSVQTLISIDTFFPFQGI